MACDISAGNWTKGNANFSCTTHCRLKMADKQTIVPHKTKVKQVQNISGGIQANHGTPILRAAGSKKFCTTPVPLGINHSGKWW
jgi:hypothetical protein